MTTPPTPEYLRAQAIARYDVLDAPREPAFDEIARLAASICGAPIAVVNLVAEDRQFFMAEVGLGVRSTPLETSFCVKALLEDELLVIPDATQDLRFSGNPLVTGDPHLRFYAGAQLRTGEGVPIGTLCILDYEPRTPDDQQLLGLQALANQVMTALELRRAAIVAQAEQARHRAIVDSAMDYAIIVTDLDGVISDWSAGAQALLGWSEQAMVGTSVAAIFREEDRQAGIPELERETAARDGRAVDKRWYAHAAGELFWASGRMSPLRDEGGAHVGYVKVLRDETEEHLATQARKSAEEALRASEALARENIERVQLALAAGAIIGTWFWDVSRDCFTVDEGFAEAFGIDPATGRSGLSLEQVTEGVHPDDRAGLEAAIGEVIARGGAFAHQYRVRRTDGHHYWIEANGHVDRAADGSQINFPGVVLDIEQRRAIEEERDRAAAALRSLNETLEQRVAERTAELMKAEEQLRQAHKMEAVGQLTGGLAHDFNNLLAGISGALEMVGTRLSQGRVADVDKYLVAAQGASRRAAALTHRLLAFSRRQTLDPRPLSVNTLVGGMADLIQRTVGPAIRVETVGAGGLWPTLVDASQLENALLNLCINARDAMPEGGRITIETANKWIDADGARTHDMPPGQYVSLCVSDTGCGMSPDVIAKAFDPFFTTKPIGQGTGLGLSMIYGFAQQSGGQVRIYSELGEGTTVCIYLPRYYGEAGVEPAIESDTLQPPSTGGETVLVVDDEPSVRMLIADILDERGYTVIEAGDSVSGLKVLQSGARIDLLVSDVGLPGGMNGRQMADAGRQTRPDLKVLFITGYAENAVIGNGHLDPGMQVLTKPFVVETLASRVRELIKG